MSDAALSLRNVSFAYDGRGPAVSDVSFDVAAGEFLCLLGPSGCGKTTCLRIAAGLNRLSDGEVWLGGAMVAGRTKHVAPERRSVGLMFQDFALFPHMNVQIWPVI